MGNDKLKMENQKPNVFVLHGWSYSVDQWKPFISALKKIKLKPVLLKIPGLTDEIRNPWALDNYIDWLFDEVKDEGKIILIGHSNGGRIAMAFALKYQDKVSKLILIDSAGIYHDDIIIKIKRLIFRSIAKTGKKIIPSQATRNFLYFLTGESDYKNANEIMRETMINLIEADKTLGIEKILAPTIIIWGENDRVTPLSDARLLNKGIVNSKLFVVNNARHSPQFTHPHEVVKIIFNNLPAARLPDGQGRQV